MMARPWAKAIATIPAGRRLAHDGRGAGSMNTNAKVPMNSARAWVQFGWTLLISRDEIDRSARSGCAKEQFGG